MVAVFGKLVGEEGFGWGWGGWGIFGFLFLFIFSDFVWFFNNMKLIKLLFCPAKFGQNQMFWLIKGQMNGFQPIVPQLHIFKRLATFVGTN